MKNEKISSLENPELPLSTDLSAWVGPKGLVQMALDAVQTLDWDNPRLVRSNSTSYQPRMMLTLLSYCYAAGRYGSREIEAATRSDPTVHYLCAREYPDWRAIRRFRKENKALILQCLHYLLTQCWALRMDEAEADYVNYEWFETVLLRKIRLEAQNRMEVASFIDLMERDF